MRKPSHQLLCVWQGICLLVHISLNKAHAWLPDTRSRAKSTPDSFICHLLLSWCIWRWATKGSCVLVRFFLLLLFFLHRHHWNFVSMCLTAIGLGFIMALPSVAWSLLMVTFSDLMMGILLCWAIVDILISLDLRTIYLTNKYFG